jgi:hypothetical protein
MEDINVYLKGECADEISRSLYEMNVTNKKINENLDSIAVSLNKIDTTTRRQDVRERVIDLLYVFVEPGETTLLGIQNTLALEVMLKGNLQKGIERMIEVCEGYILGLEREPNAKYMNLPVSELIETLRYMLEELGVPRRNQK